MPDGDRALHATGGNLGEEWSSAAAEGRQREHRGQIGLQRRHRGDVRWGTLGAPPHQRRNS